MKITLTEKGTGAKFIDDNDQEIQMCARAVTIHGEVNKPTSATIDIALVKITSVDVKDVRYRVGNYNNVVGLKLADGTEIDLTKEKK